MKTIMKLINSPLVQIPSTLLVYSFYAALIGISLTPSAALILWGVKTLLIQTGPLPAVSWILHLSAFGLICGAALYLYFITGILIMGTAIRLLSLGIREGVYPVGSQQFIRWMIYSGIYLIVNKTILPMTLMTFFSDLFFRILGCRIGKNAHINTPHLNDPQFLEIGENVIVGGMTNLSCHIFEGGRLILGRIRIGDNSLIGTGCYINPGVTIGSNCSIGMYSFIRKNTSIPDKSHISSIAGMPVREVIRIERGDRH
jgi:hypothetical protein